MPRSIAAYLPTYEGTRSIRSSVERELTTIGEAVKVLGRVAPDEFAAISHARLIVGLRNVLTHDYPAVDDETVFALAHSDVPELRQECSALLERMGEAD